MCGDQALKKVSSSVGGGVSHGSGSVWLHYFQGLYSTLRCAPYFFDERRTLIDTGRMLEKF